MLKSVVGRGSSSLLAYAASILILAAASLMAIPAMVDASELNAWGAIATGQAIGAVASVVISFGWGFSGPAIVAMSDEAGRRSEYIDSLKVRLLLAPIILLLATLLSIVFVPKYAILGAFGAFSTGLISLTANWYFIGIGRPWRLFVMDTLPRVGFTFVGIIAMRAGASALTGLTYMCIGILLAGTLSSFDILRIRPSEKRQAIQRSVWNVMHSQLSSVATGIISSLYMSLPIVLFSSVAPAYLGYFAILDKAQKQLSTALSPIFNVFQGWVPRGGTNMLQRMRLAISCLALGSLAMTTGFAFLGDYLLNWLSSNSISFAYLDVLLTGLIVSMIFMEAAVSRICLIPLGGISTVAKATFWGSGIGILLFIPLTINLGATGGLLGIMIGLIIRVGYQGIVVAKIRHPRTNRIPKASIRTEI